MTRFDLRAFVVAAPIILCVVLLLSSIGPLSDDRSLTHRVLSALVVGLVSGSIIAWNSARTRTPRLQQILQLDEATAARVDDLVTRGKKVEAVKVVRDATGAGLQTAVDTVESRTARG